MQLRGRKALPFLLLLGMIIIFTGCSSEQTEQTTWEEIQDKGEVVVGLDDAFPPFGYRDADNNLTGFDIELGKELGEILGVEFKWRPTEWSGVVMSLQTGKFDLIISGMSITKEREKEINFSRPYMAGAQVLVVRAEQGNISSKADLEGQVVGTQLGSTGQFAAEKELDNIQELKAYDAFTAAFNDLLTGRLAAVVVDDITARHYLAEKPGEFRVVKDVILSYEPVGIGIRKEDQELLKQINDALQVLIDNGTYSRLTEKWFGQDMTPRLEGLE